MGIMDMFKKKDLEVPGAGNDLGFDTNAMTTDNTGIPSANMDSFNNNPSMNFSNFSQDAGPSSINQPSSLGHMQQSMGQPFNQQTNDISKDIQMISLKLDAIKSELDAMGQRVRNIELIAEKEQSTQGKQKRWY